MRKRFISICIVVVLVLGSSMSFAWTRAVDEQGNYLYGMFNYPQVFVTYNGFASATNIAISNACSTWNSTGTGHLVFRASEVTHNDLPTDPDNWSRNEGINKVTKGDFDNVGWIAKCIRYKYNTGTFSQPIYKISESDIHFNVYRAMGSSGNENIYDVESLILHELGHAIGLNHCDDEVAVMNTLLFLGQIRRQLYQDDITGVNAIY